MVRDHPSAKKIILAQLTDKDYWLYQLIYSDHALMQHVGPVFSEYKIRKTFSHVLKQQLTEKKRLHLFVIEMARNKIGLAMLRLFNNKGYGEIGVILLSDYQSHGYSYDAKHILIHKAFQNSNIHSVRAVCAVDNLAANHVNLKIGFTLQCNVLDTRDSHLNYWVMSRRKEYE